MDKLTQKQRERLIRAIEATVEDGFCKYALHGAPHCVIGQLLFIEGVTVEDLENLDGLKIGGLDYFHSSPSLRDLIGANLLPEALKAYPRGLLLKLQDEFDELGASKTRMLEIIDGY